MRFAVTRRSALTTLGSAGLAAAGCGGGSGSTDGATPPPPGLGTGGSELPGSFWHLRSDGKLYVSGGGSQPPTAVNQILNQGEMASYFTVSRHGRRYLQRSNFLGRTSSDGTAVLNVYEHATHQAYCHVDLAGFVRSASVSPSGNHVVALRSPEYARSTFNEGSTYAIVDLMIIDISDVANIRDIRNTRTEGRSAIYGVQWLADDRFAYMTWGDGNFGDSMFTGSVAGGAQGDRLLGAIDKQGLRVRSFDVNPDESSMLLSMFDVDGVALGVWDIYRYQLDGRRIDRVTAFDQGYAGLWSPDGRHIFFKRGTESGVNYCAPTDYGCPEMCSSHVVSSTARSVSVADAQKLDTTVVPCLSEFYGGVAWRG